MKLWRNLLIAAFLAAFVLLLGFFNATKPRILILHSASQDSPWVQQVDQGMRAALKQNRRPVSVEWNYMGLGSPAATRRPEEAAAQARRAIAQFKPDIVIAVDDEANSLVARDYVGRESPRILYVSIDQSPAAFDYVGAPNVSGIAEQLPWAAVRDAVMDIFPGRSPTMAVIGVDTETDRAEVAQLEAFDWGPVTVGATALVSTAGAWRDFVRDSEAADVLVVLGTQDLPDADGRVATAAQISQWTQENARPLPIGVQGDFVTGGGGLSFSPPPDDYGQRAIGLALDWLDERQTPGPPPPVESSHFDVAVRQTALAQRGIMLAPIYLEAARAKGSLFP
jgi:hypothetical protein